MNKTCGNCANYDRKIGFTPICGKCYDDQYANDFEREPSEWKPGKHFTNADHIRAMSDVELAEFLGSFTIETFAEPFGDKFCTNCPTEEAQLEGMTITMRFHECELSDGVCPHGDSALWWLKQPYKENEE